MGLVKSYKSSIGTSGSLLRWFFFPPFLGFSEDPLTSVVSSGGGGTAAGAVEDMVCAHKDQGVLRDTRFFFFVFFFFFFYSHLTIVGRER
jgi:hypothetical protein